MKAILIIGGSRLQVPAIQWAREVGLYVGVTDQNRDVPGADLADAFHNVEGTNTPRLLEVARGLSKTHEFVGAYGSCDFALPAVAALGEAYGLPFPSLSTVKLALDKNAAKLRWIDAGLPTPAFKAVSDICEASSAAEEIGFPVIIKPLDASGSRGLATVIDGTELSAAVENAQQFSQIILIEKRVQGRHIDVNGLFWDGEFYPCGTDERFFSAPPLHIPLWLYQPAGITADEEAGCYRLLEQAARSLGIETGPVKGDLILTEAGPVILEIAPRFHGEVMTAYVTPVALKINPIKFYLTALSGLPVFKNWLQPTLNGVAGWQAIFPEAGIIKSISGEKAVLDLPGVYDVFLKLKQGDRVKRHLDNCSVAGFIWSAKPSVEELQASLYQANEMLDFSIQS